MPVPPPAGSPGPGGSPVPEWARSQEPGEDPWIDDWAAPGAPLDERSQAEPGTSLPRTDVLGTLILALVVLSVLVLGLVYAGRQLFGPTDVAYLKEGFCLASRDVQAGRTAISDLRRTSCEEPHIAQVVATTRISAAQAADWSSDSAGALCRSALNRAGTSAELLAREDLEVHPLLQSPRPDAGDTLACVAWDSTGDPLEEPLEF